MLKAILLMKVCGNLSLLTLCLCSATGVFSALGGYHEYRGDIMSTLGVFSTLGRMMTAVGDIMSTLGGV